MQRTIFFEGMIPTANDFDFLSESLIDAIRYRTSDNFSRGVVSGRDVYVLRDTNNRIKFLPFAAYTTGGERILIPSPIGQLALNLTTPEDRRLGTQGLLAANEFGFEEGIWYIIAVQYIERAGRPRLRYGTADAEATRAFQGATFYALRENVDPLIVNGAHPYIVLARAINRDGILEIYTDEHTEYSGIDASRVIAEGNLTPPLTYDLTQPISLSQHIASVGTGTVSVRNPHGLSAEDLGINVASVAEHERLFHSPGIIGNRYSQVSALYNTVNAKTLDVDDLFIRGLIPGEVVASNGSTLSQWAYASTTIALTFEDENGLLPADTYTTYINTGDGTMGVVASSGALVGRTIRLSDANTQATIALLNVQGPDFLFNAGIMSLYSFVFSQTKEYTNIDLGFIGYNKSNFTSQVDRRVFGTISAKDIQTDGNTNSLILPYSITLPAIRFTGGGILTNSITYGLGHIDPTVFPVWVDGFRIMVGAGTVKDSSGRIDIKLSAPITKSLLGPWVAGNNQGGLMPGEIGPAPGTYHIFVIGNINGVGEVAFDTSPVAANIVQSNTEEVSPIPNYYYYRRVGSVYYMGSAEGVPNFYTQRVGGSAIETIFTLSNFIPGTIDPFNFTDLRIPSGIDLKVKLNVVTATPSVQIGGTVMGDQIRYPLNAGNIDFWTNTGGAYATSTIPAGTVGVISYYDARIQ